MSEYEQELFSRFEKLYWELSRSMSYIWREIFDQHLPGSQSHILSMLEHCGPRKMSDLADCLHLTPGAVTIASDKLIDQGYIERGRDEKDRRVVFLKITDKGHEKMKDLRVEGSKAMKAVFRDLTENDLNHLIDIFQNASHNIDQIIKEVRS